VCASVISQWRSALRIRLVGVAEIVDEDFAVDLWSVHLGAASREVISPMDFENDIKLTPDELDFSSG